MTWDIVGQEAAVAVLRRAIEDPARRSHAYLFAGPERVGKATAARRFAQALNCEAASQPSLDGVAEVPCGGCRTCRLIAEDKHPDVEWVTVGGICDEAEHRDHETSRDIRICQVRRIERLVSRTAVDARSRVIVVDPADALRHEAANAFLKTLEEPAPNVVLVLVTAREEALPETVRSRCRRVVFSAVPRAEIEAALIERWGAAPDLAARLARLAHGRVGWAVAALQDERLLIERERRVDELEELLSGGYDERFSYAASLGARFSRDPDYVRETLSAWQEWWRDLLLVAAGAEPAEGLRLDSVRSRASQYGVAGAVRALVAIDEGRRHLEENASPTLAMESMLLELSAAGRP